MKSYRKELWFNVPYRRGFINITPQVENCLRESGIREGLVLVNAMHITASVFINDDESGLHADYETARSTRAGRRLPAQPHRRRQRRCPPQTPGDGPRSGGGSDQRSARFRTLGADILWRV